MIERDTDTRQVLVGSLRRLARDMRAWDDICVQLTRRNDPEAGPLGQYAAGMRHAVAVAMLGTTHTDQVDEWIAGLLEECE